MNEKLMKMFGYFIAAFVILIILIFLISSCSTRKYSYTDYEKTLMQSAKEYYKRNESKLPNDDQETKKIALKALISGEFIKEPQEFFKKDTITCDGNVTVSNNDGYYLYTPYLSCKDGKEKYETKYLIDEITKETVTDGIGLYEKNGEYIYKGDNVNNYLVINETSYRIISVNNDETIRVIRNDGLQSQEWDKIYNPDYNYESGLNEFTHDSLDSGIKTKLDKYYESDSWTDYDKSIIKTQTLCVGKRSEQDITKDGSTECAVKIENQRLGLLTTYEYLRASLDQNCSYTIDANCKNYNWFKNFNGGKTTWLITADSKDTRTVYIIAGTIVTRAASNFANINVVINIDGKLPFATGDGSKDNPYTISTISK